VPVTDVVELLRLRMEEHGLSQADVAYRAGLSASTLSRILDGTTQNPHRSTIQRIQAAVEAELHNPKASFDSFVRSALATHQRFVHNWASQISFRDLARPRPMITSFVDLEIADLGLYSNHVQRISDILNASENFVILGGPGMGKTTSLKYLALGALGKDLEEVHFLPVVVLLRTIEAGGTLIDMIGSILGLRPFRAENANSQSTDIGRKLDLVNMLSAEKILLLLDGLDEVTPPLRESVVEDLRFLFFHATDFRIVLTCRSAEYRYNLENSHVVQIAPLTELQITRFASTWLSSEVATHFIRVLRQSPFGDLARRPLMVAHLCAIYERTGMLPSKPRTVYRKLVRLLLQDWDEERSVRRLSQFAGFKSDYKEALLQSIAYHLTASTRRTSVFSHPQLESAYRSVAPTFNLPTSDATAVIRELEAHTGLIVEVGYDSYEFAHKAIQEFLVANYLLRFPTPPSDALMRFPSETAVAVTLSSSPAEYFSTLLESITPNMDSALWAAVAEHIWRLQWEQPDFEQSPRLGWTLLRLYSTALNAHEVLVTRSIKALVHANAVRESVREALENAVMEPGDSGRFTIDATQADGGVGTPFVSPGEPLEVDRDLLNLLTSTK
jgi:transcriptional regulator with XRE-family HTH domain